MSLPERRVGAQREQDGEPRTGPVQDGHALVVGGDLDVNVTAAGELLVRGQPEGLGHPLVPALADQLGLDGDRGGGQRRHLGSGLSGRGRGDGPAPAHLAVKITERVARLRISFQLLLLQLEFQARRVIAGPDPRPPHVRPPLGSTRRPVLPAAAPFLPPPAAVRCPVRPARVLLRRRRCEDSSSDDARRSDDQSRQRDKLPAAGPLRPELHLFVSFWIAPRAGIFEALGGNFCEVMINFRDAGEAA